MTPDDRTVRVDLTRRERTGIPEAVYAEGKSTTDLIDACRQLADAGDIVLATRVRDDQLDALRSAFPDGTYSDRARLFHVSSPVAESKPRVGRVVVAAAGTSDIGVAEEAALTAEASGAHVHRRTDVGVAGLHRIVRERDLLESARAIVVVAGMDGALPSVVAGLVGGPVIAVPTSVGYGAAFDGLAPLLGMLNACAPGVSVVNIDNGFGAGVLAAMINRRAAP